MQKCLSLFFPDRCESCGRITEDNECLCAVCCSGLDFVSDNPELSDLLFQKTKLLFPAAEVHALFRFEKKAVSQKIIHRLKYGDRPEIGSFLAALCAEKIIFKNKPELLVPVPLHPKKFKKRGYNQLQALCEKLSDSWSVPYANDVVYRKLHTAAQAGKTKTQRLAQSSDEIFGVHTVPEAKHYVLVDDVFTTGATLSALFWTLKKAVPTDASISVLVLGLEA